MGRALASDIVNRSCRKSWLIGLAAVIGLVGVLAGMRSLLKTSVDANKIRTAVAQTGPVENTLNATGEIIPAYEQIMTSPIRASIRRVFLTPGARVRPGQPLVELDKSLTQIEYGKLQEISWP